MKWIDLPPVWLAGCLLVAWFLRDVGPLDASAARGLGTALVGAGLVLIALAAVQILAARTTIHPHETPTALVTGGIFRLSRNPIYLGDALVLAGLALRWNAPLALLLVPPFMLLIQRRFIGREETRLAQEMGSAFDAYRSRVRRWI